MRYLELYDDDHRLAVEREHPADPDPACELCSLSGRDKLKSRCMRAEGDPGGLLVVSDYPGVAEDNLGRPFAGETGQYLRKLLRRFWDGPIALDNALRCAPGAKEPPGKAEASCRRYLAGTIAEARPTKILAMGSVAIRSITGRTPPVLSVRRGHTWTSKGVPVHLMPNPVVAMRNRFLRAWLEEDMDWALVGSVTPYPPPWGLGAYIIDSPDDAQEAYSRMRHDGIVAFDVETAGRMWGAFQILCAAFSTMDDRSYVWSPRAVRDPDAVGWLKTLLLDSGIKKVGSNIKYDQLSVERFLGILMRGVSDDTRLMRKVLDADAAADLETMAELVGMGGHKSEAQAALQSASARVVSLHRAIRKSDGMPLFGGDGGEGAVTGVGNLSPEVVAEIAPGIPVKTFAYGLLPDDILVRYCARDALTTARLYRLYKDSMGSDDLNLHRIYRRVVMPASDAARQIEAWGVPVDRGSLETFALYLKGRRAEIEARMGQYGQFNPNVHADISDVLFRRLKLKPLKQTGCGRDSTDNESLESLRGKHPLVDDLMEWRRISKMDNTYATGMLGHICPDGRVHPSLLLDGARSGRTSSQSPNMQNIPRSADSPEGKMARGIFAAGRDHLMVHLDYSQLELRIMAMLAGDQVMIDLFRQGEDLHQKTAEMIASVAWKIRPDQVTKTHRTIAKTINFSLAYGKGDATLADDLGCSVKEASAIRGAILGRFKALDAWIKARVQETRQTGYTWTWWDGDRARRRPLYRIADSDSDGRATAEHGSYNSAVQGTGSDFLIASMSAIVQWILDNGIPAKVCVPIHDALLMEVHMDAVDEVVGECRRIMTGWDSQGVPLVVDAEIGPSWGSLEKVK